MFRKFVPLTVSTKAASPAVLLVGEMLVSVGAGLSIAKSATFDIPPPGAGLVTVTDAVPAVLISAAVILAVSCVGVRKMVDRSAPFHCTTELVTNPVPLTVRVKAAPPFIALAGETLVTVGTGLTLRSTPRKTISLEAVCPVLVATIKPVAEVTFCFVETGFDEGVGVSTQGKSKTGLSMGE